MDHPSVCFQSIDHSSTHSFSPLVNDYVALKRELYDFYAFTPDLDGIRQAIEERKQHPVDRALLSEVIRGQYKDVNTAEKVRKHIALLEEEHTFTVCSAHQPSLLTGHLYFIYKILHSVRLCEYLKAELPQYHFVPVFYIGSEDNDIEELNHFYFYGKTYQWKTRQTGAVGRMTTEDLQPLLEELFAKMGPPGPDMERLQQIIGEAYDGKRTIAQATAYIINALLGVYGVIVLDPDDARLKRKYTDIIKDDLLRHTASGIVRATSIQLSEHYKSQAYVRDINLFYLKDDTRERIEKDGPIWKVVNTNIRFTEEELLQEVDSFPQRFSPNVILRGMYQERILPNIAFIGGGSEVAYWAQLRPLFVHYDVMYPVVILRQSFLWLGKEANALLDKMDADVAIVFRRPEEVVQSAALNGNSSLVLDGELGELKTLMESTRAKAVAVDSTLSASADAALQKMSRQFRVLEQKMLRAEKRKYTVLADRLVKLRSLLYPGSVMQERQENFMEYYLRLGAGYFDILLEGCTPFGNEFIIIREK